MATSAASLPPEDGPAQRADSIEPHLRADADGRAEAPATVRPERDARGARFEGIDLARLSALTGGGPVVVARRPRWWVALLVGAVLVGALAAGGIAVERAVRRAQRADSPEPQPTTMVEVPTSTALAAPLTAPPTAPASLSGGGASLFDAGVAASLAPLLDAAVAGDPTRFTSITIFADHAITIAADPGDPTRTAQATWRATGVVAGPTTQEAIDLTPALFTIGDLDWNVVAALVGATPGLFDGGDVRVDHVVVQRWGFDPAFPMRVLVYVDGGRFVEAGADGHVIAVH